MEVTTQDTAAGPVALPIDDLLDEFEKGPLGGEGEPKVEPETPQVGQETKTEEPEKTEAPKKKEDDPVAKLQRELNELRAREEASRREREHYARLAAQKALEAQRAMARAHLSDYDLTSNALDAALDKMETLKKEYASAFSEGDGDRAAEIQKHMAILGARITHLEDVKARLEQQAQLQKQRAQMQARQQQQVRQQQPQNADPFEAAIAHYSEPSKNWLRQHREFVTQPGKFDDVLAAHYIVTKKHGLQPDTKEYFEAVEKELGLREPDEVEVVEQKKPLRRTIPAAPVSRDPVIGGVDNKKVTLTPQEVQTAADLGMTKEEYAKYKLKALQEGRYDFQQRV